MTSEATADSAVTMIGLGPMGRAMTRALLNSEHSVTVWNRTPERADGVVADGAQRATTPADAVTASDLIILSLTDYQAMYDILRPVAHLLSGKVIVNLSSDTPQSTREASDWVAEQSGVMVTGGVMVPAPMIATPESYVYYSGPQSSYETHREALSTIGEPRYLGPDPELAQLMYQAQLDVFLTALSGLMHATALTGEAGIPASEFVPDAIAMLSGIPAMLDAGDPIGPQIDARRHPGDLSTTTMMGATARHIVAASESAGVDLALPRAVNAHYEWAIANGHETDNWTSIVEGMRAAAQVSRSTERVAVP